MSTRTLDWNGLLDVAKRPHAADRRITVAGVPGLVKRSRANDVGLSVHADTDDYAADEHWVMRTERELILLRHLVAAGQVTVDDDVDPWRLQEWQRRLDAYEQCFVGSCVSGAIDERGPVIDRQNRMHLACPAHWEGVMRPLGEQADRAPDTEQAVAAGAEQAVAGAGHPLWKDPA